MIIIYQERGKDIKKEPLKLYSAHHGESSPRLGFNPREQEAPVSGPHRKHIVDSALHNVQYPLAVYNCKHLRSVNVKHAQSFAARWPLPTPAPAVGVLSSFLLHQVQVSLPFSFPFILLSFFSTSIYSTYILSVRGFLDLIEVSPSVDLLSLAIDGVFSDQNVSIFWSILISKIQLTFSSILYIGDVCNFLQHCFVLLKGSLSERFFRKLLNVLLFVLCYVVYLCRARPSCWGEFLLGGKQSHRVLFISSSWCHSPPESNYSCSSS